VLDLPERPAAIHFDRAQFELMILNLAANAEHAMPEGGRFRIAVQQMDDTSTVAIDLHDTGHGMSEDVRARIFEPFFTTKPSGQGTGLGLVVTRDLIVSAGGSIEVDSSPGAGAAFRIRLPVPAVADLELAG
jgi:signal transduction histidine kinase